MRLRWHIQSDESSIIQRWRQRGPRLGSRIRQKKLSGPFSRSLAFESCEPREMLAVDLNLHALQMASGGDHGTKLAIAYACSPPFRELTAEEDARIVADIQDSGAQVLFVGMGCPKQERWIIKHQGVVPAPMLGVGAAFDFIAGVKRYAPAWLQRMGLEWLFRLLTEPRRLWRRYAVHNPRFVVFAALQLFGVKNFNF